MAFDTTSFGQTDPNAFQQWLDNWRQSQLANQQATQSPSPGTIPQQPEPTSNVNDQAFTDSLLQQYQNIQAAKQANAQQVQDQQTQAQAQQGKKKSGPWGFLGRVLTDVSGVAKTGLDYVPGGKAIGLGNLVSSVVQAPYVLADIGANAINNLRKVSMGEHTDWTPEINVGKGLAGGALGLVSTVGTALGPLGSSMNANLAKWSRENLGKAFEARPAWDRPEGLLPGLVSDLGMVSMGAGVAAKLTGVSAAALDAETAASTAEQAARAAEATAAETGLPEHQAAATAAREEAAHYAEVSARAQRNLKSFQNFEHPYQSIWNKGVQPFIDAAVDKGYFGENWNPTTLAERSVARAPDAVVSALQSVHDAQQHIQLHGVERGGERQVEAKRSEVLADERPAIELSQEITRATGGEVPYEQAQAIVGDQLMRRGEATWGAEQAMRAQGVPEEELARMFGHDESLALPEQFNTPEFHARLDEAAEGAKAISRENTATIIREPHLESKGIDTRQPYDQTITITPKMQKMREKARAQFEQAGRLEARAPAEEAELMDHIAEVQERIRRLPETPEKAKILEAMANNNFKEAERLISKVAPKERAELTRRIKAIDKMAASEPTRTIGTSLLMKGSQRKLAEATRLRTTVAEQERTAAYKQIAALEAMIRAETRQARRARLQAKVGNLHAVITSHSLPSELAAAKLMQEGTKMAAGAAKGIREEKSTWAVQRGKMLEERERLIAQSSGQTPSEVAAAGLRARAQKLLEDAQVRTQKDYERTVAKLQAEIERTHEQLREGNVPSRVAAAQARTKGEKIIAALQDRMDRPALENVPAVWQPLYSSFQQMWKDAEEYPELESILDQYPKTFHQILSWAEEHGFDPVHFTDMTTQDAKRLMYAHVVLGQSWKGLGSLMESTSRKTREGILSAEQLHDRSLEAIAAGTVKTIHELRTNQVTDAIRDQFARRPLDGWYDAQRNVTRIPTGWRAWDPIENALTVGDRLEGTGAQVVHGKVQYVIPTAVYNSLRRYSTPVNHPFLSMIQRATMPWKTYQLSTSPMFYFMHIIGHALLAGYDSGIDVHAAHEAWKEFRNGFRNLPEATGASLIHEARLAGHMGPNKAPTAIGPESLGAARQVYGATGAARYALHKMRSIISTSDALWRAYVMIHDLGGLSLEELHLPENAARLEHAVNRAREALVDMEDLSSIERNGVRALIPFYAFHKGIFKLAMKMPLDHPGMAALMIQMAKVHQANQAAQFGGMLPAAYTGMENIDGTNIDLTRLNPFRDIESFTNAQSFMAGINPIIKLLIDRGVGKPQGTWNVDPATGTLRFYPSAGTNLTIDRFGKLQPTPDFGQTLLSMIGSGTPGKVLTALTGADLGVPKSPLAPPPSILGSLLPIKTDQQVQSLMNRIPQAQFGQGLFDLSQAQTDPITGKPIAGSPLEGLLGSIRSQQAQNAAQTRAGQPQAKRSSGTARRHRGGPHKVGPRPGQVRRGGGHTGHTASHGARKGGIRTGRALTNKTFGKALAKSGTKSGFSKLGSVKGRTSAAKGFKLPSQRNAGGRKSVSAFGGRKGGSTFSGKRKGMSAF